MTVLVVVAVVTALTLPVYGSAVDAILMVIVFGVLLLDVAPENSGLSGVQL